MQETTYTLNEEQLNNRLRQHAQRVFARLSERMRTDGADVIMISKREWQETKTEFKVRGN